MRNGKRKIRIRPHAPLPPEEVFVAPPKIETEDREPLCANCVHWSSEDRPRSEEGSCLRADSPHYYEHPKRVWFCAKHEFMHGEYSLYDRRPEPEPEHPVQEVCGNCRYYYRCHHTDSPHVGQRRCPASPDCEHFNRQEVPVPVPTTPIPQPGSSPEDSPQNCADCFHCHSTDDDPVTRCYSDGSLHFGQTRGQGDAICIYFDDDDDDSHEPRSCLDCFHCFPETRDGLSTCHEPACAESGNVRGRGDETCPFFDDNHET